MSLTTGIHRLFIWLLVRVGIGLEMRIRIQGRLSRLLIRESRWNSLPQKHPLQVAPSYLQMSWLTILMELVVSCKRPQVLPLETRGEQYVYKLFWWYRRIGDRIFSLSREKVELHSKIINRRSNNLIVLSRPSRSYHILPDDKWLKGSE